MNTSRSPRTRAQTEDSRTRAPVEPDAGWKVLYQGRPLKGLADTKERKFAKEKEIIFKRSEEEQARKPPKMKGGKTNFLGVLQPGFVVGGESGQYKNSMG